MIHHDDAVNNQIEKPHFEVPKTEGTKSFFQIDQAAVFQLLKELDATEFKVFLFLTLRAYGWDDKTRRVGDGVTRAAGTFVAKGTGLSQATAEKGQALLRNWTQQWWNKPASELNRADGRDILRNAEQSGRGVGFRKRLKYKINLILKWGIEERLITGVQESPLNGLTIEPERGEKRPEILTVEEIRTLLKKAQEQKHAWYPIWVGAILTGCRSGELHELRKSDLEIISREQAIEQDKKPFHDRRYGFIRVRRSWNTRAKEIGPTKAGYWRTVPISSEFFWFLTHDLNIQEKRFQDFVFPRFWEWTKGEQARVLRGFCISNQIPSIKFHTLRACFATQLISTGIPATTVMKICGWKDFKTMQRYIRFAGIDEAGATESLRFIPTEEAVMEKVVSLYNYRKE